MRRRSRSRRTKSAVAKGDWAFRTRKAWRSLVTPAMLGLTVVYGGYVYYRTYSETVAYDAVAAGMSDAEVLYVLGEPASKGPHKDRTAWTYATGERLVRIDFNADGKVANIFCTSKVGSPADCNPAHRVELRMTEDQVWYLLGKPPVQMLEGTNKIIAYPALGLTIKLVRFRVAAIARQPLRSPIGVLPSVIRILVP